ncbi:C1GALT1 [Symbiodinium sp. KB8]|nr:C1GALT1 [Symbiodinium sp. KB8]
MAVQDDVDQADDEARQELLGWHSSSGHDLILLKAWGGLNDGNAHVALMVVCSMIALFFDKVSHGGNEVESTAEFLSGGPDVRVLFSIQTAAHNVAAIRAAAETWASAVPPGQLQVIGMSQPKHWEMQGMLWDKSDCPDTHSGGACKDFTALSNAWQSGFDWVVLLGSDNYAMAKNIKAALASRSPSTAEVLGIRGCGKCKAGGLCGGGGQIFSRGALEKMVGQGKESYMRESMKEANACGMWGDVSNCRVAAAHHVPVHDLPGLHGWKMDDEELQQALLSPYPPPLTFHYLQIDEIRALHAMVASNHESFFESGSIQSLQAQGLSRWYVRRDRYVAEEQARRQRELEMRRTHSPEGPPKSMTVRRESF